MNATTPSPRLHDVAPQTLHDWLAAGDALVVDVREADEQAREQILGSVRMPLSSFDPEQVPLEPKKRTVLVCRSGNRSRDAARRLFAAGATEVHHLEGGLMAWSAAGFTLDRNLKVPISIMRQVQIAMGALIVATSALGAFVSPWFLAPTAFVGAGLLVAGSTGTCAMASMLERMPWNGVHRSSRAEG